MSYKTRAVTKQELDFLVRTIREELETVTNPDERLLVTDSLGFAEGASRMLARSTSAFETYLELNGKEERE